VIAGIADTHTALWHLFDDARLSASAGTFIDKAAAARLRIAVSSISLAEIVYLIEKNRLPPSAYDDLKLALADPDQFSRKPRSLLRSLTPCDRCPVWPCRICRTAS
jgi:PIN domain nuclease of toxin-antitoxin system